MSVLNYARLCCDTMMKKYPLPADIPPTPRFHYHAGVFLSGMERVYELCGEKKYDDYIRGYIDTYVDEDGRLTHANLDQLDDIQPCTLMYRLCDDEPRYRKVLDEVVPRLLNWKTTPVGGFWHKDICPDQVWLDGMYMSGLLGVRYGLLTGKREYLEIMHKELEVMWRNMRDETTGLLYHAWDYSKKAEWANKESGCSSFFWGRALGWYAVAAADLSEYLEGDPLQADFTDHALRLVRSLLRYQDEKTGLWYQVVDRVGASDNWTETSCSCLFLYGICNLIRRGILEESYVENVKKAYEGIIKNKTRMEGDTLIISDICIGTGVGDYEFYVNRPTSENDLHGTGAFLLMCSELERLKRAKPELF